MTIHFFYSKVFTVIFLCLLTNLSIPKASASTGATSEYDTSDGASELIAQRRDDLCRILREDPEVPVAFDIRKEPDYSGDKTGRILKTGDLVRLAEDYDHDRDGWIRIDLPQQGYIPTGFLAYCEDNTSPEIPGKTTLPLPYYQIPKGKYQIKQGESTYLFRENTYRGNQLVIRFGEPIILRPGNEVMVEEGTIFRNAIYGGNPIQPGEDPNEHGWLKVKVQFPGERPYEGYIEYKHLDIPNSGNRTSSNSEQICRVTRSTNIYETSELNPENFIRTITENATITISTAESFDSRLRVISPQPGWIFGDNNVECGYSSGGASFVSSSPYYCLTNNINWQGNFLPVFSDNGQRIYDLPMNQPVFKTGGISQYNSYEFVEIEITNGFGGKLTGWVENRPLFGQYRNIENLRLC